MPMVSKSAKRPVVHYVLLVAICGIATVYHAKLLSSVLQGAKVNIPFFSPATASAAIELVDSDAVKDGLHVGDVLVAINGRRYTGTAILAEEIAKAKSGTPLMITV